MNLVIKLKKLIRSSVLTETTLEFKTFNCGLLVRDNTHTVDH